MGSLPGVRSGSITLAAVALALAVPLIAGCGEKQEPATTGPVLTETTTGGSTSATTTATTSTTTEDGGSGIDSRPPQAQARQAIVAFLAGPNPEVVCGRFLTPKFIRRAYGDLKGCISGRNKASLATTQQILSLKINGARGTAQVRPKGGVYDGQKLEIGLLGSPDGWRIDTVSSNVRVGP